LGDPTRPGLVFLHGFLGRGADWHEIARRFSASHFCILPDLPGHGANTLLPEGFRFDYPTLHAGLESLLERLGLEQPALVGYSLGGRVALGYCLRGPQRIRALALESASPGLDSSSERRKRAALDSERAERIAADGLESFLASWYRAPLFASLAARPALLKKHIARNSQNSADWMAQVIRELSPGRVPSYWDRLPELSLPMLLLAGELDCAYRETLSRAAARLPRAQLKVIPRAGHNIHLEQPEAFVAALQGFLSGFNRPLPPD
jgi:2-succinyl-6-hydroxy-2,4-cyclohexadiene-1-carboxylate synthase